MEPGYDRVVRSTTACGALAAALCRHCAGILSGIVDGVEVAASLGVVVGVRFQLVVLAEGGAGAGCVVFYRSWSVMS